jgi:hypothetical protein
MLFKEVIVIYTENHMKPQLYKLLELLIGKSIATPGFRSPYNSYVRGDKTLSVGQLIECDKVYRQKH